MHKNSSNLVELSNIRLRILLLTLITLVPFIVLVLYINAFHLKRSEEIKVSQLKNITHLIALENEQIVEGVRQLLTTLSVSPQLKQTSKLCSTYLSDLLNKYRRYGNFGIIDLDGNVTCSAIPLQNPLNLSDRYFFRKTLVTSDFSVGEYVISRATKQASVNFGYPLSDKRAVVYATLNLNWLNTLISGLDVEKNLTILVLDRGGTVLAKNHDPEKWIGQEIANTPLITGLTQTEGIIETSEIDGVERIYSYERIGDQNEGPFVIVGQSKTEMLEGPISDFKKSLTLFAFVAAFSVWVGLKVGNSLIAKAVEKLSEIEGLKRDFISLASHQIRTPITAIKWFTEILLSKSAGKLTKKQESILKDTHISTKRMIELIGTLLDIAKLESMRFPLNFLPTSLIPLVKEVVSETKKNFKDKKIDVHLKVAKNVPTKINVDRKLIRHVFMNLLHNSFKYSDPTGKVRLELTKNGSGILVKIIDNGIGIPPKEQKNLFQKFSRASNAKLIDTEGAGLGLYLAKLITKAHGGRIGLLKKPGKGVCVYFTIPAT